MKPLPFIIIICIHLATKFFWDYGFDYSIYDKRDAALKSGNISELRILIPQIEAQEREGANRFALGITFIMLFWVSMRRVKFELTPKLKILLNGWIIWVASDFLKEVSFRFGILKWFFANPLVKDLNEYIAFFISAVIVLWQMYRLNRSK